MTNIIDFLKGNPDCFYIYNRDFSIYGLPDNEQYTIVVDDNFIFPEEYANYDSSTYKVHTLTDWFNMVLTGKIEAWECACLNKKYVIKEHVKLLLATDILQLRRDVDSHRKVLHVASNPSLIQFFNLAKDIRFSIQIAINHKILNYKDALVDYCKLKNVDTVEERWEVINTIYNDLKLLTDGVVKQNITKKANAKSV